MATALAVAVTPLVTAEEVRPPQISRISRPFQLNMQGSIIDGLVTTVNHAPIIVVLGGGANVSFKDSALADIDVQLAQSGFSSVVFDYRGVGDTAKLLPNTSLDSRLEDALAVIRYVRKEFPTRPLYLLGISMGGDLAIRASDEERVEGVILVAPMAYQEHVRALPFGNDMKVVKTNRIQGLKSPEFATLERYEGKLFLAYPRFDDVIPKKLLQKYHDAVSSKGGDVLLLETTSHIFLRNPEEKISKKRFYTTLSDLFLTEPE
jgi:predicted alpha/beta-fold hydrolase